MTGLVLFAIRCTFIISHNCDQVSSQNN